ncbi:MAG TPA: metallophosphoesterase family protein [Verrucomicrobiae bacterium]|nr:metallophosphoesterase family protein [Verrucomicrobiae bacterium]
MRYLVFGDVHANLTALDAVLAAGRARGVETYLFVGDLVGYGPEPLECIERLLPLQEQGSFAWVVGNHELAVRGDVDLEGYSNEAMQTLQWTKTQVERTSWAQEFLESGYLTTCVNDLIWLAHDSLASPGTGSYHRWPQKAKSELACLRFNKGRVCFYGHTHKMRAELHNDSGIVMVPTPTHNGDGVDKNPIQLQEGELGWIGVGSVGFPTNSERRSEFVILDDSDAARWLVEKYEMAYSREKARARLREVYGDICDKEVVESICRWL